MKKATKPIHNFLHRTSLAMTMACTALVIASCNSQSGNSASDTIDEAVTPITEGDEQVVDQGDEENSSPSGIQGGDDFWAELAQNYEPFVKPPGLGAAVDPSDYISLGLWEETIDWPLIATGAANLPDGRIVAWSSQDVDDFGGPVESTQGTIYDPITGSFEDTPNSTHDMFCSGVSMLEDGRVFVAGGGSTVSSTSIFDTDQFTEIEPMAMTRWYPTSTTLASGQVLTSLGTNAAPYPEIWTDGKGWSLLPEIDLQSILDAENVIHNDWYPALNVAPDGSLFHPGHMPGILSIYMDQEDPVSHHGEREENEVSRLYSTTVMYDIGKMLIAGGGDGANSTNTALTMDVNGPTPIITPTEPMKHVRSMQNSVVLPNGEVLVIGGNSSGIQFSDDGTVLEPELWNPQTESWRALALHDRPRNYHSVALLLKDGRVLSAGGGLCGACPTNHQNGEIYSPPYLFDANGSPAPRPTINNASDTALPGDTITLSGSDDIVKFNMLRLVAITHHHTTDQRLVPVDSVKTGTGQYALTLNSNSNVLLPGYYWIFGLNADGTPSEGRTIRVLVTPENIPDAQPDTSPNIAYEYYEENWSPFVLPDFDTLVPVKTGTQADFSLAAKERNNFYAFRFRGTINVPVSGEYTFFLSSDDGSKLIIDNQVVVDFDGIHSFEMEESNSVTLNAGEHSIEVQYFEVNRGDALLVSWQGPVFDKRPISAADLGSPLPEPFYGNTNPGPSIPGQVSYRYYEGQWTKLPDFANESIVKEGQVVGFDLSPRLQDDFYGFEFRANITVENSGDYTFYTGSDDGSRLSVNGITIVNNDGLHPVVEQSGTIELSAGTHKLKVEFFDFDRGDSLDVSWSGPGFAKQAITNTALASDGSVESSTGDTTNGSTAGTTAGSTDGSATDGGTDGSTTDGATGGTTGGSELVANNPGMVSYKYFEGSWTTLPDFSNMTPIKQGESAGFDLNVRDQNDFYGLQFTAKLSVPTTGAYTLFTTSDDGSRLFINDQLVVNNDGLHAPVEKQGTVNLTAGEHDLVVEFFEFDRGDSLTVAWQGPAIAKQPIPLSALSSVTSGSVNTGNTTGGNSTGGNTGGSNGDGLINYQYFEGQWFSLPNFNLLTPVSAGQQSSFSLAPKQVNDNYSFRFATNLDVPVDGLYAFYLASDDGSRLSIDGSVLIDNDGPHANRELNGSIFLSAGTHHVLVEYFELGGLDTLSLDWSSAGMPRQALQNANLSSADFAFTGTDNNNGPGDNKDGGNDSSTDGGTSDTMVPPAPSDLQFEYYEGSWTSLPNFDLLTPLQTGETTQFTLPPSNGVLFYAYRFTGQIFISEDDVYTFFTASNDGSQLRIDDVLVVNNDGKHGVLEKQGSIQLSPGLHDIEVTYFQSNGTEALDVLWSASNLSKQTIDGSVLFAP